jgi:hypothetical protein
VNFFHEIPKKNYVFESQPHVVVLMYFLKSGIYIYRGSYSLYFLMEQKNKRVFFGYVMA